MTDKLALASAYAKPQIRNKKRPAAAAAMPALNRLWLAAPRAFGHGRMGLASAGFAFINVMVHLGTADTVQYFIAIYNIVIIIIFPLLNFPMVPPV